ncbi:hypothetical protein A9179_12695 [Pseudomonas alcaligenes]|uniref:Uncharacterized protein n=1 Tax=Aquipseudomonas alcaligenes TaxID=43263 RepID=A0ABR7S0L1_AQUAC|nr:hypothetical protein [Pseudomonas alcaligenes]
MECLICNSSAVLTRDAASAIARMLGIAESFIKGAQRVAVSDSSAGTPPLAQALNMITGGTSAVSSDWEGINTWIQDMQRYQFMGHTCLCLRCGALFDAPQSSP